MKTSRSLYVSLIIMTLVVSSLSTVLFVAGLSRRTLALTGAPQALEGVPTQPASPVKINAVNPNPPDETVKLVFIHHSSGENWLSNSNGVLLQALNDNNYYVSDGGSGGPGNIGSRTDIGDWYEWFAGPNSGEITDWLYNQDNTRSNSIPNPDEGRENEIVMFKSCFPNSNVWGNPDDPPNDDPDPPRGFAPNSPNHNVANVKRIYIDILEYFEIRQDRLFIVITAPPLRAATTDVARAANARAVNNWLVHEWLADYPYHNVAVFDFYNVLTTNGGAPDVNDLGSITGNHHRLITTTKPITIEHKTDGDDDSEPNYLEYPSAGGTNNHPSQAGNRKATGEFVSLLNAYYSCWKYGDCWDDPADWIAVVAATDVASVHPGETATHTLSVTASEGFATPVTFTLQGAPSEALASFDPNPVTPPGTSQLHITTTPSTVAGVYAMPVTGTSGALTDTANLVLIVTSSGMPSFTLGTSPTVRVAKPNQMVSYTAAITGVSGFSQPVTLTVVGLPAGVGEAWSANPVTPDSSSILTLSIPGNPPFGDCPLYVVGTAETQFVATGIALIVDYPFKHYLPIILK